MTLNVSADLDLSPVRTEFPSLSLEAAGHPAIYLDNPGGTQVHQSVIEAFGNYYLTANSNTGGAFLTSQRSEEVIRGAREAMADLLNAASPSQIIFGQNMTTLTFGLARAFGRTIKPGDEIIVTELDHDANVAPWLAYADQGAIIKSIPVIKPDCTLDMAALREALSDKTPGSSYGGLERGGHFPGRSGSYQASP
ncbi:MAG TPA: aminotransferase class V-fold PLP-dependent enzyme [Chloroflexia bacterium]|nr:aminotransferase class V-fold PLP-dependent enzyme [Chloroflexia bacterium]